MSLFRCTELEFARMVSRLVYINPFAIAADELDSDEMTDRAGELARVARGRLIAGEAASAVELELYEDVVLFHLYRLYADRLAGLINDGAGARVLFYKSFAAEMEHHLRIEGVRFPGGETAAHLFAGFFQICRANHHISTFIAGTSRARQSVCARGFGKRSSHMI